MISVCLTSPVHQRRRASAQAAVNRPGHPSGMMHTGDRRAVGGDGARLLLIVTTRAVDRGLHLNNARAAPSGATGC
jgi:hypothetical protein